MFPRRLELCVAFVLVVGLGAPAAKTASEDAGLDIQQVPLPPTVTADIGSRYIQIDPDVSNTEPVAFRVECGDTIEWVQLIQTDYDDVPGGNTQVNVGVGRNTCDNAYFLKPDAWTSSGANALVVTGLSVAPGSRPTVYAVSGTCTTQQDSDPAQPASSTWAFCDSDGDGQTTFFNDLFKQFANSAAGGGGGGFTGPHPGTEVDTQGDWPTVPDQQITTFDDVYPAFLATTAGGPFPPWFGRTCP